MKDLFLPYNLALLAKEKGFNELCFGFYQLSRTFDNSAIFEYIGDPVSRKHTFFKRETLFSNSFLDEIVNKKDAYMKGVCSAPLYQQIVDWIRDKHDIEIIISSYSHVSSARSYIGHYQKQSDPFNGEYFYGNQTHYDALNKTIEKIFALI